MGSGRGCYGSGDAVGRLFKGYGIFGKESLLTQGVAYFRSYWEWDGGGLHYS